MHSLIPVVFAACLIWTAFPTGSSAEPSATQAAISPSRVAVGGEASPERAEARAGSPVVFHNGSERSTRLVFSRRDAKRVDCSPAPGASRSRRGQYTLEPGAEVACSLPRGDYEYSTFTTRRGAVASDRARLRVR